MSKKRVSIAVAVCFVIASVLSSTFVMAVNNDDITFKFRIGAYWRNGTDPDGRYRETNNVQNQWKVKMTKSEEGAGTVSNFWLENAAQTNVSNALSITQGNDFVYQTPKSTANRTTVYLSGENNNYNGTSYTVEGFWDEETW